MDTISAIRNIIRQGLSNAQGNSQYIKPRQDEGLGGSMGRILQLIGQSTQQNTPVGTPQTFIPKAVGSYATDIGQTLERLSSTQGRQQTIQGAQQLPKQLQQKDFIAALQNPATQDALNVMDFLPVGAIAGGVKAVGGNKAVREAIEAGVKSKAGSNVAGEVLKRVVNKVDPLLQEARKYKSADDFVNSKGLKYEYETIGNEKRLIIDLFPTEDVVGKGITKAETLRKFKEAYKDGHKIIEPSNGLWTKQGAGFINNLENSGVVKKIENRGGIERYQITPKITSINAKNSLTDIYNQAKKLSR